MEMSSEVRRRMYLEVSGRRRYGIPIQDDLGRGDMFWAR